MSIHKVRLPDVECLECGGCGRYWSATNTPCRNCAATGKVAGAAVELKLSRTIHDTWLLHLMPLTRTSKAWVSRTREGVFADALKTLGGTLEDDDE